MDCLDDGDRFDQSSLDVSAAKPDRDLGAEEKVGGKRLGPAGFPSRAEEGIAACYLGEIPV
jgi:hypothetical protein